MAPRGQAGDEVLLRQHDEEQDRQQLHGRGGEQHAPVDAVDRADHLGDDQRRGLGRASTVKMKANRNSFQANTMTKTATASMPCAASGRITRRRIVSCAGAVDHAPPRRARAGSGR